MSDTLIIFAKAPRPGHVKTRLYPELSPDQASDLYRAFVRDVLESTGRLKGVRRVIGCDPSSSDPFFQSLKARYEVELIDQQGADLGARMRHALEEAVGPGAGPAVIIGTDSPTLPTKIIEDAFACLRADEVVLGPSSDGGYYLVGCEEKVPPIFEDIPWGTSGVLDRTLRKVVELQIRCSLLPFWYDVDTIRDLLFLSAHLEYLNQQGDGSIAPETRRILKDLKI